MSRFWQFSQLSAQFKNHRALDHVSGVNGLLIGGLKALDQPDLLEQEGVTHILSLLDFDPCDHEELTKYKRLLVQVDDDPTQDGLQHFSTTNAFIDKALNERGTVLVHCAMGVSRSATVICAYLMYKQQLSPQQALKKLRETRPLCSPNPGFLEQLDVYQKMLTSGSDLQAARVYDEWIKGSKNASKL